MKRFGLGHRLIRLYRGQTLMRILMDEGFAAETLRGTVVDVGGGRRPDYFDFFKREGEPELEPLDRSLTGIDFERDPLPQASGSVDTLICANLLEHIYHHARLLAEMRRVLSPGGELIGFVPFWVGYHPDPHDYFRYTREALEKLLAEAGFADIKIRGIGGGPIIANFNTIVLSVPPLLRPMLYCVYAPFDALFLRLRPASRARNPLGFIFTAHAS